MTGTLRTVAAVALCALVGGIAMGVVAGVTLWTYLWLVAP